MYSVATTMSNGAPAVPAKQRRQTYSEPHDKVSFGSNKNDETDNELLNKGMRKRETIRYRRDISVAVGQQPETGRMTQHFDVRVQGSANKTENPFDENPYETIGNADFNNSDDIYLHPVFLEPDDSTINRRRVSIKRWSIDKVEKNKRLSATSSVSSSKRSFSDDDSDDVFNTEEDNLQLTSRKHGGSSIYGPLSIYRRILLVLAIASLTCVFVFGLLLIFKPQTDSSGLMEVEKLQDRLMRQETTIKDLSARLDERNSVITHLMKDFAHLKADFDYIIQNFQNNPKGRPDS